MQNLFLIKLLLSFLVGGSYIAFTIWVSEKFGSRIGGLLIGLPSTILVSLIFIAWTQSPPAAVSALPVVPAALAANSLFLVIFIRLYKYGRAISFSAGLIVWLLLSFPLVFFSLKSIGASVLLASLFFGLAIYWLRKFRNRKLKRFQIGRKESALRMIFAGSLVAVAVCLGKILGPLWGGMLASFPVAFSSSFLLLENKYGIDFASATAKTMPYGSMGNVLFAVTFFYIVPLAGLIMGTMIGYLAALLFALAVNEIILKREREIAV